MCAVFRRPAPEAMNSTLLAGIVAGLALVFTAVLTPVVRGAAIAGVITMAP